jgi:hypothetical protein
MNGDSIDCSQHAVTDDKLRTILEGQLNSGLDTEIEPRAYDHEQIIEIVARLQTLARDDYANKLVYAGFTTTPYNPGDDVDDDQACETCMYYLVHRRFCELPELMVPVEENWSCRLWRI